MRSLAKKVSLGSGYGGPGGRAMRRCLCSNVDVTVDDVDVTIDDDDVTVDDDDVTFTVHARWIKITSGTTPARRPRPYSSFVAMYARADFKK